MEKPLTKAALSQIKREYIQRAISAVMHILHDSHLYKSRLWPRKGLHSAPKFDDYDTISVQAFVSDINQTVIINFYGIKEKRMTEQMNAVNLIIDEAVYDGILFNYKLHLNIGLGDGIWSRLNYDFTITD